MDGLDAGRVLRGEGGDDGCTIGAERTKRLEVRLDACSARTIRSGNAQNDGTFGCQSGLLWLLRVAAVRDQLLFFMISD